MRISMGRCSQGMPIMEFTVSDIITIALSASTGLGAAYGYVYFKGKKDTTRTMVNEKLSSSIDNLTDSISVLHGDIGGLGTRVRKLEDDKIRMEERFITGDYARREFVPTVVFNERMNSIESKLDLLINIEKGSRNET